MDIEDSALALGRIERDETNPTHKTLIKIANTLEVKLTNIVNIYDNI